MVAFAAFAAFLTFITFKALSIFVILQTMPRHLSYGHNWILFFFPIFYLPTIKIIHGNKQEGEQDMCISCGCGKANDKHNNPDLITQEDLEKAAKAAKMSPQDAAKNIADAEGLTCQK